MRRVFRDFPSQIANLALTDETSDVFLNLLLHCRDVAFAREYVQPDIQPITIQEFVYIEIITPTYPTSEKSVPIILNR